MITTHNNLIFNPKRGIQKYSQTKGSNPTPLTQNFLTTVKTGVTKSSVIYRYYFLDSFINTDISTAYLNQLQADLVLLAQNNMTVLLRFAYKESFTEATTTTIPQQPSKNQILAHIAQIAPILNNNVNSIMAFQMGFIGTWGEWYYTHSSEFGHAGTISSLQWANRKEIVDACLNQFSSNIPLQLRYVKAFRELAQDNLRIGFYNDAFLNNWGDNGTFSNVSQNQNPVGTPDYELLREVTQVAFMTGETNGLNPPRTNVDNALVELSLCNWDTLNDAYFPALINEWKNTDSWAEIVNKLGYRFQVESATFNLVGTTLSYNVVINNVGFAPLKFDADFKIVATKNGVKTILKSIPLRGIKGVHNISGQVNVNSLEGGGYQVEFDSVLEFANTSKSLFYNLVIENTPVVDPEPTPTPIEARLPLTHTALQNNGFVDFEVYNSSNVYVGNNPTLRPYPRGVYTIRCKKNQTNFIFTVKK